MTFQKSFTGIFNFGYFSWYHAYIFEKKVRYAEVEFNAQLIGNNFRSQKIKNQKAPMLFPNWRF